MAANLNSAKETVRELWERPWLGGHPGYRRDTPGGPPRASSAVCGAVETSQPLHPGVARRAGTAYGAAGSPYLDDAAEPLVDSARRHVEAG